MIRPTSDMSTGTDLRTTFDAAALDYDAARPGYPAELIEDIISISAIPENGRILEIGCGTGQATAPFAKRGYWMTCLDIGKELAAVAAQKCCRYPKVSIQTIAFEDWRPGEERFDLVMSATSFHWIAPEVRYAKTTRILKNSGYMALFWNLHPTPYTGFFQAVQEVYQRVVPEWSGPRNSFSTEERIRATEVSINGAGLFEQVQVRRYPWAKDYSTEEYLRLLNTYSDHRSLEGSKRSRLFGEIGEFIENRYGGIVTRPYLAVLYIAKRKVEGLRCLQ